MCLAFVPGGGVSLHGKRWIACKPGFFLPVKALARIFRRLFLAGLEAAFDNELCGKVGCAPKARDTCGGRFHPDSCRLVWKLTSESVGQLAGLEPRDKGRLGRLSDPAGRNVSEV